MAKIAETAGRYTQNPAPGLTPFPSLLYWEDPWEAGLNLIALRKNAAAMETVRQLSMNPHYGEPLATVNPAQIAELVKVLALDDAQAAVLIRDAQLIIAWYELPGHQARVRMGHGALIEALDKAANPVRNLHDRLAPLVYEAEELLQDLPPTVVGAHRDFDMLALCQRAVEFSSLVDRIIRYLRPPKRNPDLRRNVAIALAVWAAENACGEAVRSSRGTRTVVNWHFTNSPGIFVRDLMGRLCQTKCTVH